MYRVSSYNLNNVPLSLKVTIGALIVALAALSAGAIYLNVAHIPLDPSRVRALRLAAYFSIGIVGVITAFAIFTARAIARESKPELRLLQNSYLHGWSIYHNARTKALVLKDPSGQERSPEHYEGAFSDDLVPSDVAHGKDEHIIRTTLRTHAQILGINLQ